MYGEGREAQDGERFEGAEEHPHRPPEGVGVFRLHHPEQLVLRLAWGREPWAGVSPRHLTRGSCVVDKSVVGCPSREADGQDADPAQFTLFLKGRSDGS